MIELAASTDDLRGRAGNHKWLPDERRWSCETDIVEAANRIDDLTGKIERASSTVNDTLTQLWHDLMNDCSASAAYFHGAIDVLGAVGLLDTDRVELWKFRGQTCPVKFRTGEHINDDGRQWCAFCGELEREKIHGTSE